MITATSNTIQTYTQTQQTVASKSKDSNFDELLQSEQTLEAQQAKTEEVRFKMIERMSFEFIKNIGMDNIRETIDTIYADLSEDEQSKIAFLRHLANTSENDTLNKVMFNEAKKMSPSEARTYSFQKMSEHNHYKLTGTANLSLAVPIVLDKYPNGIPLELEEVKLSHEEAFNMLLNMIEMSKEGIESSKGELQDIHRKYYEEYSDLLEKYNNELRKNMTGII